MQFVASGKRCKVGLKARFGGRVWVRTTALQSLRLQLCAAHEGSCGGELLSERPPAVLTTVGWAWIVWFLGWLISSYTSLKTWAKALKKKKSPTHSQGLGEIEICP